MKKYKSKLIACSAGLSIVSFLINSIPILSIILSSISFISVTYWWYSKHPKKLQKDLSKTIGKDISIMMMFFCSLGMFSLVGFATIAATEPILGEGLDTSIWPTYNWYFFVWYLLPTMIGIFIIVNFFRKAFSF